MHSTLKLGRTIDSLKVALQVSAWVDLEAPVKLKGVTLLEHAKWHLRMRSLIQPNTLHNVGDLCSHSSLALFLV